MMSQNIRTILAGVFLLAGGIEVTSADINKTLGGIEYCVLKQSKTGWDEVEFCLYNPAPKNDLSGKKYPLVLLLHGSPPADHTLDDVADIGAFAKAKERRDFILIAPRTPQGKGWPVPVLDALLDEAMNTLPVDPDRVYITGFSLGAIATWTLAFEQPDRFAALLPVCGYGDASKLWKTMHIPTWLTHGDKDRAVNISGSKIMFDTLKQIGASPEMTIFPDTGHNAWTPTYEMDEVYDWMLAQKRTPAAPSNYAKKYCALIDGVRVHADTVYLQDEKLSEAVFNIEIDNTSPERLSLNGKLELPDGVMGAPSTFDLDLNPLECKEFAVKISATSGMTLEEIKGLALKWQLSFSMDGLKTYRHKENSLPLCITKLFDCPKAETPIAVDGNLQEWRDFPYELKTHDGIAKYSVIHDDEGVYVAVHVADADVQVDPQKAPWQQDGVEIRIDARPDPERTLSTRYREFKTVFLAGLCPSTNGEGGVYFHEKWMPEGTRAVCRETEEGYVLELKVPAEYLDEMQTEPWNKFRFNITVDDFDEGQLYQYYWQPDWRADNRLPAYGTFSK